MPRTRDTDPPDMAPTQESSPAAEELLLKEQDPGLWSDDAEILQRFLASRARWPRDLQEAFDRQRRSKLRVESEE